MRAPGRKVSHGLNEGHTRLRPFSELCPCHPGPRHAPPSGTLRRPVAPLGSSRPAKKINRTCPSSASSSALLFHTASDAAADPHKTQPSKPKRLLAAVGRTPRRLEPKRLERCREFFNTAVCWTLLLAFSETTSAPLQEKTLTSTPGGMRSSARQSYVLFMNTGFEPRLPQLKELRFRQTKVPAVYELLV